MCHRSVHNGGAMQLSTAKYLFFSIAVVAVLLLAILVWPTCYRYDYITGGDGRRLVLRINRVTGRTWMCTIKGWKEIEPP